MRKASVLIPAIVILFASARIAEAESVESRGPSFFSLDGKAYAGQKTAGARARIARLSKSIVENPREAKAYHDRGLAYAEIGHFQKAGSDFETAISIGLDDLWVFANYGSALLFQERYADAAAAYSKAIDGGFKNVRVFRLRGCAYMKLKRLEQCRVDFSAAISLSPGGEELAGAYYCRGRSYVCDEQWTKAAADFSEAIKLNDKEGEFFVCRAATYSYLKLYDEAISDCDAAIRLNPKDETAYTTRGLTRRLRGELKESLADYNEAIKLQPADWMIYANRAVTYFELRDFHAAISDCDTVFVFNPNCPSIERLRATAKRELGEK